MIWNDYDTSPPKKDGRLLLLIVCYEDDGAQECEGGALEDAVRYWRTIGHNNHLNVYDEEDLSEGDEWQTVGWDWCQDEFTSGPKRIRVVKWAEYPDAPAGFGHLEG